MASINSIRDDFFLLHYQSQTIQVINEKYFSISYEANLFQEKEKNVVFTAHIVANILQ